MYYAHSTDDSDKKNWQLLKDHLENVADLSGEFAKTFNSENIAYSAGLLHDIGKYSEEFQKRLEGSQIRVDHSTAGAIVAGKAYPPLLARILEYTISGHHGGLRNYGSNYSGLGERLNNAILKDYSAYKNEITVPDLRSFQPKIQYNINPGFTFSFYIRMLYSCLVDADFFDTERFIDPDKSSLRGNYDTFDTLAERFDRHMDTIVSNADNTPINSLRADIFEQCKEKAALPPQMFTMTVPTGGGKTLSSMAFALKHLEKHDLKKIFYIIPYTSIIEQNAEVFRTIFGEENVLEHHSNFDPDNLKDSEDFSDLISDKLKLSSENWDIPITVTTNVQFFESLFSNKSSRCRKLHNLAQSVIILDEAQMVPTGYLKPCLAALSELVRNYGTTVVICTATQPRLEGLLDKTCTPVEMVESPELLYEKFQRITLSNLGECNDEELSGRLKEQRQVLCIVNTRKHAQKLYEAISETTNCFHLSARMCPVHRRKHLKKIKTLLETGEECRVISTQLIEAGVDIDFPVVYRAMAGIDSIAQAAGRCNREGKLASGTTYIFKSTESYGKATSWQKRVAEIGEMTCNNYSDPLSLPAVDDYFRLLYFHEGEEKLDKKGILPSLEEGGKNLKFPFEDVGANFTLIEQNTRAIVIPCDKNVRKIIDQIRESGFAGKQSRKLQGYTVNVYPDEFSELIKMNALELIAERFYVLTDFHTFYSNKTGLINRYLNRDENELLIFKG